jgi:hypothetical protein
MMMMIIIIIIIIIISSFFRFCVLQSPYNPSSFST